MSYLHAPKTERNYNTIIVYYHVYYRSLGGSKVLVVNK